MKILIVDDSLTQRVMLEAILRQWEFEPLLAEDGQQALQILSASDAPRLVLLDWEMPGLDGLEVCRRVRENQDEDPPYILLLTARSETADIVTGMRAFCFFQQCPQVSLGIKYPGVEEGDHFLTPQQGVCVHLFQYRRHAPV